MRTTSPAPFRTGTHDHRVDFAIKADVLRDLRGLLAMRHEDGLMHRKARRAVALARFQVETYGNERLWATRGYMAAQARKA